MFNRVKYTTHSGSAFARQSKNGLYSGKCEKLITNIVLTTWFNMIVDWAVPA